MLVSCAPNVGGGKPDSILPGTYVREYDHAPPSNLLLEGRGTQSGAHVDIMGNFALIEDIIRVAAGATGEDLGGNQVYTDIFKWSEKINLQL